MTYPLYIDAVVMRDFPAEGLRRGDVVVLVDHHFARDGTEGYSVEISETKERPWGVATIPTEFLRPVLKDKEAV
ncbi:MAG TPA: hypothetical protein VHV47_08465 [Opitutaceae bacterium]|jgi:hypothetical protein|nr:hypothetical protein [Opitutaceae bacterium]